MDASRVPDRTVTVPRESLSTVLGATRGMLDTFKRHGIATPDTAALRVAADEIEAFMAAPVGGGQ